MSVNEFEIEFEIKPNEFEIDLEKVIKEVYPELENLTITPSNEEQKFKSSKYGYDEVTVKPVEGEILEIIPTMEKQNFKGLYEEVNVEAIQAEELTITPNTEKQVKEGLFNKVTVAGEPNLIPENIAKGKNIFGVEGTVEGPNEELEANFISLLEGTITSIRIPAQVTKINSSTFYDIDSLEEIIFEGDIKSIKGRLLSSSSGLKKVIFPNITSVPELGSLVFFGSSISSGTGFIYVPDNLVDTFKANSSWSSYQIKPISELEA